VTVVGVGGIEIIFWKKRRSFHKEYGKLEISLRDSVDKCLQALAKRPIPSGLRFEKLKGYAKPDIYSVHVTGNYKISMEIEGNIAILRRVASHDEIDRCP
jgi:plasmid maintenance system killer protein